MCQEVRMDHHLPTHACNLRNPRLPAPKMRSLGMKVFVWTLGVVLVLWVGLWLAVRYVIPEYDARTRERVLQSIALEVPIGSNDQTMQRYMQRHTVGFDFDKYKSAFGGRVAQSWSDRNIFPSRTVIIYLKRSPSGTFSGAEVWVTYTLP